MERKVKIGLQIAREKKDISETELAAIMKVDVSVINSWEAGVAFPSLEAMQYLAKLLNTTTEMLLFSEQRQPLDISKLSEAQQRWVIDFYSKMIKHK